MPTTPPYTCLKHFTDRNSRTRHIHRTRRTPHIRRISIILAFIMLITTIAPVQLVRHEASAAATNKSDRVLTLLQATKSHMDKARQMYLTSDREGAYAEVARGEAKLQEALRTNGASDPKYGNTFATSGYVMSTVLHPTTTGVEYVRMFTSDVPCGEAGCQGVPASAIMMIQYTDSSTSTIRSHIVPLPGDSGEVEPFFLHVLKQYGLFRTESGDIIMLCAMSNWRGGGWSLTLRNLSRGGRLESYSKLFNKSDLPEPLLKQWDDSQRMFLGLCDEGEASATCSVKVAEQTALTAINEDAGTVTFGTKVIQLRNVVKVKSTTERVKLRALISGIAREGTITNIGVRPGEQYFVATQLGEPLSKRNNMLFYRGFTLQTDAIGTVNHIYYPPREAGLSQVTLGWLEKQLGTAAVSKNGSYSVSVIIRSRFNLTRLTFTAPNRNSRPEVITLSGSLPDETRDYELSAVSFNA